MPECPVFQRGYVGALAFWRELMGVHIEDLLLSGLRIAYFVSIDETATNQLLYSQKNLGFKRVSHEIVDLNRE